MVLRHNWQRRTGLSRTNLPAWSACPTGSGGAHARPKGVCPWA